MIPTKIIPTGDKELALSFSSFGEKLLRQLNGSIKMIGVPQAPIEKSLPGGGLIRVTAGNQDRIEIYMPQPVVEIEEEEEITEIEEFQPYLYIQMYCDYLSSSGGRRTVYAASVWNLDKGEKADDIIDDDGNTAIFPIDVWRVGYPIRGLIETDEGYDRADGEFLFENFDNYDNVDTWINTTGDNCYISQGNGFLEQGKSFDYFTPAGVRVPAIAKTISSCLFTLDEIGAEGCCLYPSADCSGVHDGQYQSVDEDYYTEDTVLTQGLEIQSGFVGKTSITYKTTKDNSISKTATGHTFIGYIPNICGGNGGYSTHYWTLDNDEDLDDRTTERIYETPIGEKTTPATRYTRHVASIQQQNIYPTSAYSYDEAGSYTQEYYNYIDDLSLINTAGCKYFYHAENETINGLVQIYRFPEYDFNTQTHAWTHNDSSHSVTETVHEPREMLAAVDHKLALTETDPRLQTRNVAFEAFVDELWEHTVSLAPSDAENIIIGIVDEKMIIKRDVEK